MKNFLCLLCAMAAVMALLAGCGEKTQPQVVKTAVSLESEPCGQPSKAVSAIPEPSADRCESPPESTETEPASTTEPSPDQLSFVRPESSLPEYAVGAFDLAILEAVNQARVAYGLPTFSLEDTACRLAYVRAREAAVLWSHTRPDGQAYHSVYLQYQVPWPRCVGENLAKHLREDAQKIVDAWMGSEGHRKNILHPDFSGVGIAVYCEDEMYYIANLFVG